MTQEEFYSIEWHRGNVVKLQNGKEYLCKGQTRNGRYLILYSLEYDTRFIADYNIVVEQVSDYAEPEEVYLKRKAEKQAAAEAKRQAEIQARREEKARIKEELKQKHLKEQEEAHLKALQRKAAKKLQRQQEQEAKQSSKEANSAPAKPVASKAEKPLAETPKVEALEICSLSQSLRLKEPAPEAPKKRVRQRIHITKTVGEKVEYYKKGNSQKRRINK